MSGAITALLTLTKLDSRVVMRDLRTFPADYQSLQKSVFPKPPSNTTASIPRPGSDSRCPDAVRHGTRRFRNHKEACVNRSRPETIGRPILRPHTSAPRLSCDRPVGTPRPPRLPRGVADRTALFALRDGRNRATRSA